MAYKIGLLILVGLVPAYLLLGVVTTVVMRLRNPLKKRCRDGKRLCLTFDDGMDPRYTPRLLDLLAEHGVRATFFVLASTAERHPALLRRMAEEGHVVALHSYDHKNQILELPHRLCRDFQRSVEIFASQGVPVSFYRAPWGHITPLGIWLCRKYGLQMVLWTVIIGDWKRDATVEQLCGKLYRQVQGSAVICLHDGRGKKEAPLRTIAALERMIPYWKEEGYVFETIPEFTQADPA